MGLFQKEISGSSIPPFLLLSRPFWANRTNRDNVTRRTTVQALTSSNPAESLLRLKFGTSCCIGSSSAGRAGGRIELPDWSEVLVGEHRSLLVRFLVETPARSWCLSQRRLSILMARDMRWYECGSVGSSWVANSSFSCSFRPLENMALRVDSFH